jgi:deoxyribonuclease V
MESRENTLFNDTEDFCDRIRSRFNPRKAFHAQKLLAKKVIQENDFVNTDKIGGLDLAYSRDKSLGIAVLALIDFRTLKLEKCYYSVTRTCIPYIPGLLAFREMPPASLLLSKARKMGFMPSILMVDGHGIAHPRKLGIASHIGVVFDVPTIGVAKKRLVGIEQDDMVLDRESGKVIAKIVRRGNKKVYVSIGHRVSLETAVELVEKTWVTGKLPLPTLIADKETKRLKSMIEQIKRKGFGECGVNGLFQ